MIVLFFFSSLLVLSLHVCQGTKVLPHRSWGITTGWWAAHISNSESRRLLSTKPLWKEACTLCSAGCRHLMDTGLTPVWGLRRSVPKACIFLPEGRMELLQFSLPWICLLLLVFFFWLTSMLSGLVPWWLHMGQTCPPGLRGQASLRPVDSVYSRVGQFIHLLLYNLCLVFEMPRIILATSQQFCLYGTRHFICIYTNI